ncbi:DMT family transporter [Sandaracinus amylolyticus]|uniref:DMT family transporter n=1 Tax=Sandaracinus amylolyticus TaxID=927083 RepID=UPI001F32A930|nr:multidrug efflux SMR transporter [Sandaracinus amylolyticus]UJR84161.1 Hypothetical protein I5071_62320 [Sandaracinus amylolyticus]
MSGWLLLIAAIVCEVGAFTCMKLSEGFTRAVPSVLMMLGYLGSFGLVSQAIQRLDLSTTYAVWSGLGTAAVTVIGLAFFGDALTVPKVVAIALIIAGVVVLHASGGPH